eukprot:SAG11_NODE_24799_length_368_cov_0.579926_1_plen_59_part_01
MKHSPSRSKNIVSPLSEPLNDALVVRLSIVQSAENTGCGVVAMIFSASGAPTLRLTRRC